MNKTPEDFKDSFIALKKACYRLAEALAENYEENHLAIDATIQRFEFCHLSPRSRPIDKRVLHPDRYVRAVPGLENRLE